MKCVSGWQLDQDLRVVVKLCENKNTRRNETCCKGGGRPPSLSGQRSSRFQNMPQNATKTSPELALGSRNGLCPGTSPHGSAPHGRLSNLRKAVYRWGYRWGISLDRTGENDRHGQADRCQFQPRRRSNCMRQLTQFVHGSDSRR